MIHYIFLENEMKTKNQELIIIKTIIIINKELNSVSCSEWSMLLTDYETKTKTKPKDMTHDHM